MTISKPSEGTSSATSSSMSPLPEGIDRRSFLVRHAVIGAAAVMTGTTWTLDSARATGREGGGRSETRRGAFSRPERGQSLQRPGDDPGRRVLQGGTWPLELAHDRADAHHLRFLPALHQAAGRPAGPGHRAEGSPVRQPQCDRKGHGTERASLAGLLGKEPATVDPLFLDEMIAKPQQTYPVTLGGKTFNLSLADVVYDAPKGEFPHPNTMTCKLMGGDKPVYELEYYSVGGGFIEWKGYQPPKKNPPKYPFATMKELRQHAEKNNLSIAQVIMANETSISGKSEADVNAFLDKIAGAMLATVKVRPVDQGGRAARPDQAAVEGGDRLGAGDGRQVRERPRHRLAVGLRACGLRGERPRPSGHHGADRWFGRSHAGRRLWPDRGQAQGDAGKAARRPAGGPRHRLSLQAQRHPGGCRRRLPVGDRRRFGDGRGAAWRRRSALRRRSSRTPPSRRWSTISA